MNSKLMQVSPGRLPVVRFFALVLTLVGLLWVQMPAGVAQAAPPAAPSATYDHDAELECWVDMPHEVSSGEYFEVEVEVNNVSDVKAKDVTVFTNANPSGYFEIYLCEPNCRGNSLFLGKLKAWQSKTGRYDLVAPNEEGYFTFNFYVDAHNAEKTYCGSYDLYVFGEGNYLKLPLPIEEDDE